MKDLGRTTTCMAKVTTAGVMAVSMKVNTTWTRSTAMGSTTGQMAGDMKDIGKMENSTVRASIFYLMGSQRLVSGRRANASGGSNKSTLIATLPTRI